MRWLLLAVLALLLLPSTAEAHGGRRGCGKYSGEKYIICRETGGFQARYMADGAPHYPGTKKTASGPYGLLADTRRNYRCANVTDRECALRYLDDVYDGSWKKAEARARRRNFW